MALVPKRDDFFEGHNKQKSLTEGSTAKRKTKQINNDVRDRFETQ
jgi:hypothetical protein